MPETPTPGSGSANDDANTPDNTVTVLGDYVIDHVFPVEDSHIERWEDEDWFPREGESLEISEVPDPLQDRTYDRFPGGKGPNQAAAAALSGAETRLIGRTGEKDAMLESLTENGVDLRYFEQDIDKLTAQSYIFLEEDGENRITCVKESGGLIDRDQIDKYYDPGERKGILDSDYLLVTNGMPNEPLEHVLERLSGEEGRPQVIFDPSPVDRAEEILAYDCIDMVTPNEVEYETLRDEIEAADVDVLKTSSEGVSINDEYMVEAPDVDVADTAAAGDAFNGFLAGCLAQGMELDEAAEYAVHAASLSVTREGTMDSLPRFEEVEVLMDDGLYRKKDAIHDVMEPDQEPGGWDARPPA